jgi:hypothetical protein
MPILFGHGAFIKLGKESAWATGVSTTISNRINDVSLATVQERNRKANLSVPASGMLGEMFDGFRNVEGSISMPIYYQGQGQLIEMAFGKLTTTGAGAPYTHKFEPDIELDSATIEVQRGSGLTNQMEKFVGVKVSSISFTCEAGGELTASIDFTGKQGDARATNITSSFGTGKSVLHFHASKLSFDGNNYDVRSMNFTLNNSLERRNVLGSIYTAEQAVGDVREATLEVTLDTENSTLQTAYLAGTQANAEITFTNPAGGTTESIHFEVTNAVISSYSDPVSGFGRVEQTVVFTGLADSSNVGARITVLNGDSTGLAN